MEATVG